MKKKTIQPISLSGFALLSACFLLGTAAGHSQETQKDSITQLNEVVVTENLPAKVATGITPSAIVGETVFQNYAPTDFMSSVNQISGVYLLSGALNTNRITIRGVGARTPYGTDKIRMYYNNIPVTDGSGFSGIGAYDLENLGHLEIIKGPKGTAYGTNLGGAMVLSTKVATEEGSQLSNSFTVGSYNLIKNLLAYQHHDEKVDVNLTYGHMETDGYRENNSYDRDGVLLTTTLHLDPKNEIGILANYIDYTAQIPSTISKSAFDEDPRQAAFTWGQAKGYEANKYTLVGLSYAHTFSSHLKNTTGIYYTYLDHYEPRPFDILDEFTNGFGLRTVFEGNIGNDVASYSLGAELYKDEYHWGTFENLYEDNNGNGSLQGDRLSQNNEFRRQYNIFGTFLFPFTEQFSAQVGLNLNHTFYDFRDDFNTGDANTSAQRTFDAILLPSLTLNYDVSDQGSIYANVSRGFSNPSLEETLTPEGVINPDIAQEKGTNYEVGTHWALLNNHFSLDLALYHMDINDLLVAQRVGDDQYVGKNAGKTRHEGIEVDAQYALAISHSLTARPFISYTLNHHKFVDFVDGDNDYSGNVLTGVPQNRVSTGLRLQHSSGLYWNTTYQYVDKIPLNDATTLYSDSYGLVGSRLGYNTQLGSRFSFGVHAGVNNLFDEKYASSVLINAVGFGGAQPRYYYPGNGRNYYAGLQLKYRL